MNSMIEIEDLSYTYPRAEQLSLARINLKVGVGTFTVILGATGAGKTTLTLCLNGLIPQLLEGKLEGRIRVGGMDVAKHRTQTLAQVVGMVFQDPESQIIGITVYEDVAFGPRNLGLPEEEVQLRVKEALAKVRLSGYESRRTEELSGGEKQRLAIAGVLAMRPSLLILDEPTSELDPLGRLEVFATLDALRKEKDLTILMVEQSTEDVLSRADEIVVLQKGTIAWQGPPAVLFRNLQMLRTLGLRPVPISVPFAVLAEKGVIKEDEIPLTVAEAADTLRKMLERGYRPTTNFGVKRVPFRPTAREVIKIRNLSFGYKPEKPILESINLTITAGEFIALIGANGAGKTTLTKHLNGLLKPTAGEVWINGRNTREHSTAELARIVGTVFQNPDHQIFETSVEREIAVGLKNVSISEAEKCKRIDEVLTLTGLHDLRQVHPLTLGKGQRQLLAVACILAVQPEILVIDEPTTGLDWTESQKVIALVKKLHEQGTTIIMITHDMEWVAACAERVIVMQEGKILYDGATQDVFKQKELLNQAFLIPPQIVRLSQKIEEEWDLAGDWLHSKEFVRDWFGEGRNCGRSISGPG